MQQNNERTYFIFDNNKITAGGLLIYNNYSDKYLLQYNYNKQRWDDFGGKVNKGDETIFSTIKREVLEESNNLIGSNNNQINFDKCKYFYIPDCKYLLAIIDIKNIKIFRNLNKYGKYEKINGYKRKLKWVKKKEIMNNPYYLNNINVRLFYFFNRINNCIAIENINKISRTAGSSENSNKL